MLYQINMLYQTFKQAVGKAAQFLRFQSRIEQNALSNIKISVPEFQPLDIKPLPPIVVRFDLSSFESKNVSTPCAYVQTFRVNEPYTPAFNLAKNVKFAQELASKTAGVEQLAQLDLAGGNPENKETLKIK